MTLTASLSGSTKGRILHGGWEFWNLEDIISISLFPLHPRGLGSLVGLGLYILPAGNGLKLCFSREWLQG